MMLLGSAAGATFPLPATTNVSVNDTAPVSAGYSLRSDGKVSKYENGSESIIGDWIIPSTTASSYEVVATLNSGTLGSGTVGSPLNLGSTRLWSVSASFAGTGESCQLGITIRVSGGGATVATATVNLEANYL